MENRLTAARKWVTFGGVRRIRVGVLTLLGAAATLFPGRPARAAGENQLTFDFGAASFGMTHAWREVGARFAIGGGGNAGLFPLPPLGATYATGTYFDYPGVLEYAEIVRLQTFLRVEPTPWLRLDGGVCGGVFAHAPGDGVAAGEFLGLFVAPALAWRWLWIGPRVSGNLLREHGGQKAGMLVLEYVMLRFVKSW